MRNCNPWAVAALAALALAQAGLPSWAAGNKESSPACPKEPVKAEQIKVLGGDVLAFDTLQPGAKVSVPLSLPPGIDAARVTVKLVQLRRDKLADPALQGHFAVTPKLEDQAGIPLLQIAVDQASRLAPATYWLLVRLHHPCVQSTIAISLERPAATVQKLEKLVFDLDLIAGFGAPGRAAPGSVRWAASENVVLAALREPTFRDLGWRDAAQRNINASLNVGLVAAGKTGLELQVGPTGFPVGNSTGKLEINSPDLKAPITVDVEVKARLYGYWIPVLVVLGLIAGLQLREWLPQRIALSAAEAAGAQATAKVREQVELIKDAQFLQAVKPALEELERHWMRPSKAWARLAAVDRASSIVKAQDAAKAAIDSALADLAVRMQAARGTLAALIRVAAQPERLPPPMHSAFAAIPDACEQASAALEKQDAAGAQSVLDRARSDMVRALRQAWSAWLQTHPALDADLNMLRALMDPRRDTARGYGPAGTVLAQRAYDLAAANLGTPDFEDLAAVARGLDAWRDLGAARSAALALWVQHLASDTGSLLWLVGSRLPANANLDAEAEAVRTASAALLEGLRGQVMRAGAFEALAVDPKPLFKAASDLVRACVAASRADAAASAEALQLLDQRQYFSAVLALPYRGEQEWAEPIGDAAKDVQLPAPPYIGQALPIALPGAPARVDAATLEQLRLRATREVLMAQRWTSVVVGLITVLVSYAFFQDRFVGTAGEVLGLFFWGMSADLSAAGLTALQNNLATPPKKT
jgi:hypothetical protein